MSEHGAALQTYNQELVKCLEELKNKRSALQAVIEREESEKIVIEKNMRILQEKLQICNNSLMQHVKIRNSYDQTIKETELGFKKILESSQTLLNLAQHEASKLSNCIGSLCKVPNCIQYNSSGD